MAATIQVITYDQISIIGTGSGSILTTDGYILTNAHVVGDTKTKKLANPEGRVTISITTDPQLPPVPRFIAQVCAADFDLDLAVIKPISTLDGRKPADALSLPFAQVGDSSQVEIGDEIRAIGFPGIGGDTVTLTRGIVAGRGTFRGLTGTWIKTDLKMAPGNSGGMIIIGNGNLIGVPTIVITDPTTGEQIGLVRPINDAQGIIQAARVAQAVCGQTSKASPASVAPAEGVVVTGKIVDVDTGKPINGAGFLILKSGVTLEEFDKNPSDARIAAMGRTDPNGDFQTSPPIERDQVYGVIVGAKGYRAVGVDRFLNITTSTPAKTDLGFIVKLRKQ